MKILYKHYYRYRARTHGMVLCEISQKTQGQILPKLGGDITREGISRGLTFGDDQSRERGMGGDTRKQQAEC